MIARLLASGAVSQSALQGWPALDRQLTEHLESQLTKNVAAAARSSTAMPTFSKRWIVMRLTVATRQFSFGGTAYAYQHLHPIAIASF